MHSLIQQVKLLLNTTLASVNTEDWSETGQNVIIYISMILLILTIVFKKAKSLHQKYSGADIYFLI